MSEPTKTQVCYLPERGMWRAGISKTDGEIPMICAFAQLKNEADAHLWAEATNVYTQTGLTPTELAAQRAELLGALQNLLAAMPPPDMLWDSLPKEFNLWDLGARANQASAAIDKATSKI